MSVFVGLNDTERLDACGEDPSVVCGLLADRIRSVLLVEVSSFVVDRLVALLVIFAVAFVAIRLGRYLIQRVGRRLSAGGIEQLEALERSRVPWLGRTRRRGEDMNTREFAAISARSQLRIDTLVAVISSVFSIVVWTVAVVTALGLFSINLAPLLAGAGVVGVALGFGAQSVVADFLSGFFMVIEDQFGVGDVIDAGDASGAVEKLSLRTTTLRDVNGVVWHVRNSEIRRVGNKSQLWSRAVVDIDVAYDTDLRRAEGVIQRVADDLWQDRDYTDGSIIAPPEVWGIERLGPDGVSIRLVVKTHPADQWTIARELRLRIKEALDEAGIEIPFPQRTLWIRQDEAAPSRELPKVDLAPVRGPQPEEETGEPPVLPS